MPFVTRPHFEDRQIVQYNEDEIKLSGTSKIAPVILDFTGTTTGATTVEINGLTGYLNGQRQYGFVVEPAQLKMSGSTGTTEVDVTGYVLTSMDSKGSVGWIALSGGPIGNTYVNSGSVVGNDLILNWNTGGSVPAIALPTSSFTGNTSASCITDIYVKNIHSCSPLNIQPNDEGNVYFGSTSGVTIDISGTSVGIGTINPMEKLHVSGGDILIENGGIVYSDLTNPIMPKFVLSATSSTLGNIGVTNPQGAGLSIGYRGETEPTYDGYGKQGDGYIYSSASANGLNIISQLGSNKDDYIRFYVGQSTGADPGNTPDIHIQGSGSTRGNVGINTKNPTEKLDVRGDFVTINTGGGFKTNLNSASGPAIQVSGGSIGLPRVTVVDNPNTSSLSMGVRGWSDGLYPGYGEPGDGFIYSSDDQKGLNILSTPGTGTDDYIRFYAGKDAVGGTPDIHIQGSGTTKGNVGLGTINPTEKLHVNGSVRVVGDSILHSDTITSNPLVGIAKGQYTEFNWDGITGGINSNSATSGSSSYFVGDFSNFPTTRKHGSIRYYGSGYTRSGGIIVPTSFYQNKVLIAGGHDTDGMVIKGKAGDPNGTLWFEFNGSSVAQLYSDSGYFGLGLNPDGSEKPTTHLQVGGTGTTGSFKFLDGNEQNGYVLTSDANGVASWQPSSGGTSGTTYWVASDGGSESIKTDFTSHYINSDNSLMGGGVDLVMSGANNTSNTMLGGEDNKIISDAGFSYRNNIIGGENNTMIGRMADSTILGGVENSLQGYRHSIIGGEKNSIGGDANGFILGGSGNTVTGNINSILGGVGNLLTGTKVTIVGGENNHLNAGENTVILGGSGNTITSTDNSAVIGGSGITGTSSNTVYTPNLTVRGDKILHSDTVLEVSDLPSTFEDEIKGSYTSFNWSGLTTSVITNNDEFGYTSYILGDLDSYPTNKRYGFISYYNAGYEKSTSVGSTTSDFYSEKLVLKAASDSEGMVISPHENDGTKALWVEHAGNSIVKILANGPDGTPRIGVGMDPTGVENALASFQIGGTGNTASFRYLDGQETDGYVLKCDSDGYATWEEEYTFTGNTSATCITDLYVSNVYGCSPITFHNSIQSNGSTASGDEAIAFGENCTSSDDKTFSFGVNNSVSGERSFIGGGIDNTIGTGNNNFIVGGDTNTIGTGNNNSIVGGSNNTISPGVNNSIILGADGITVSKSNQTHTKSLFTSDMSTMAGVTVNGGPFIVVGQIQLSSDLVTTGNVAGVGPTISASTIWAINLTGANTSALPDGDSGQRLAVYVRGTSGLGNTMDITPATLNGATTITLTGTGSSVDLIFDGTSGWTVMGGNNYTLT